MKLKCQPDDFQVEELADFTADGGPFALYRLTKQSLGTPEAIELLRQRWHLPRPRISYGGLKDKHALTRQFVTVHGGRPQDLQVGPIQVEYLGQASRPFTPRDIRANRFHIVLRDLASAELDVAIHGLPALERDGVPNYFDDQRFGSVGHSGEFFARPWCAGDYERTLWLALTDPRADDTQAESQQKRGLREHWGDWARCLAEVPDPQGREVLQHLVARPTDFRGAWSRIAVDLRGLYLSAFQSFLWNRLLAAWLRQELPSEQLAELPLKTGPVPYYRALTAAQLAGLENLRLPLPSARLHLEDGPIRELLTRTLAEQGLELRELRVKYPRDSFFSKGLRPVMVRPADLQQASAADERYPGRSRLTLKFTLPRGAYATLFIKRLVQNFVPG